MFGRCASISDKEDATWRVKIFRGKATILEEKKQENKREFLSTVE